MSTAWLRGKIAWMVRRWALLAMATLVIALGACTPSRIGGPTQVPAASSALDGTILIDGRAHAGPTCPVVTVGDPACADRPVAGAVLVITTTAGAEVTRITSAADGSFSTALAPGDYILVPQPVAGLMGTAQPVPFHVPAAGAAPAPLDVGYDTGIR